MASACARKFLYVYVSSPPHAFSGNSMQLQWHDSIHLSLVYTDYSFPSWHNVKGKSQNYRVIDDLAQPQWYICPKTDCWRQTHVGTFEGGALHCFCPRALKTLVTPLTECSGTVHNDIWAYYNLAVKDQTASLLVYQKK